MLILFTIFRQGGCFIPNICS